MTLQLISVGTDAFKFSFFPWSFSEWNKIDIKIRNSPYSVSYWIYQMQF